MINIKELDDYHHAFHRAAPILLDHQNRTKTMKTNPNKVILLILSLFAFSYTIQAQTPYILKQTKMSVSGSSSLHEWESEVAKVEWAGTMNVQGNQLTDIKDVVVKIKVTDIKSTKGSIMDNKTYDAFDYEKNPLIQFKLTSTKITGTSPEFTVTAAGNLTMAGVTKPIDLSAKAKMLANGDVQLVASKKLNMKNHNMKPPTAMMGTIKVGEEVTVAFDLILTPKK